MRKRARLLAFILSLSMIVPGTPVFAAEDEHNHSVTETEAEAGTSRETNVLYAQDSDFVVMIPKAIALGSNKTANYNVSVKGSVLASESVTVEPAETFLMHEINGYKRDVTAESYQDDYYWRCEEITPEGTVKSGSVSAEGLTAGSWQGDMTFYINMVDESVTLSLSLDDDIYLGSDGSVQVNAYMNGEEANDYVTWTSSNENISVANGLVKTKASAQPGDSAVITVSAEIPQASVMSLSGDFSDVGTGGETLSTSFAVTVVDIAFTNDNAITESVDIAPGDSKTIEATIIPASASGDVKWTTTAMAGINLVKNGNAVSVEVTDDMTSGKSFSLIASYGDFSKLFTLNIVPHYVHSYTESITKAATCTEDGLKTFTCECGDNYTEKIDALGHDFATEYTVDVVATCTTAGSKSQHCSRCDAITNVTEIPATGHTSVNGGTEDVHAKCSVCGTSLSNTHTYTKTVATPATCTEKGTSKYTCSCGYTYTSQDIPATGHSYGDWSVTKAATCTEAGSKHRTCATCGNVETATIAALGHDYASTYTIDVAATCTTAGSKSQHCSRCDAKWNVTEIPATGHNPINGYCTVCSEKVAGLYDTNGIMLCNWEESGIDAETNYKDYTYKTSITSGYYVLTNNYPTATKVVIPDNVTSIGTYAFYGCTSLSSIIIPDSVTSIGSYAFNSCSSLTNVTIPDSVTIIGQGVFKNCTGLTNVTIGNGVTLIKDYAFANCTSLTNATIGNNVTSIGYQAFYQCSSLTSITIPDSVISMKNWAFRECTSLSNVIIGNNVTSIGTYAFYGCTSLTSIEIPDSVTSIGSNAFGNCLNLTNVTIGNGVTSIEDYAFANCKQLTSINIPDSVTSISAYTFKYCYSLTNIIIPGSVTSIGYGAFWGCSRLTSITIPDSVTSIGDCAFNYCSSLTSIIIPDSVTSIGKEAFSNCKKLTSVTFKTTAGWYVGSSAGAKTTALSSSDLANTSTAASYLRVHYYTRYWTR